MPTLRDFLEIFLAEGGDLDRLWLASDVWEGYPPRDPIKAHDVLMGCCP